VDNPGAVDNPTHAKGLPGCTREALEAVAAKAADRQPADEDVDAAADDEDEDDEAVDDEDEDDDEDDVDDTELLDDERLSVR
jgi:hypothetical protein